MGYTHYWTIKKKIPAEQWDNVTTKCQRILDSAGMTLSVNRRDKTIVEFNGSLESYEDFYLENIKGFRFCKTNQNYYDKYVTACLIVLYNNVNSTCVDISSDGEPHKWLDGLEIANAVLKTSLKLPPR